MVHKVLVTGASGLLGRAVMKELSKDPKWEVVGTGFTRVEPPLIKVDLTNIEETRKCVRDQKPTIIIHAAAQRSPDKVDFDYAAAERLNVEVSRVLAEEAKEIGAHLIYISTDYVFDGKNPPYKETDATNPLNKYGLTKLRGEQAALVANENAVILRIPVLYGEVKSLADSAVTVLFGSVLNSEKPAKISDFEIRCPAHTQDIARILEGLCSRIAHHGHESGGTPVVHGIYQWSGKEAFTKYQMATLMGKVFGLTTDHILPGHEEPSATPRPRDVRMDTGRLDSLGIMFHTPFAEGIEAVLRPFLPSTA